jgi:hypothetical protein
MSRPSLEENVRKAVREYLLVAQNKSPDEAPPEHASCRETVKL